MDSRVLPTLRVKVMSGVQEFNATQWQMLSDGSNPFVSHGFLATLEESRCVGGATGWQPNIVALYDSQGVAAAAPSYLKAHSYGEFVFDFAWAQAYSRHGLAYYPKMIVAVPFTPATGPRLLIRADLAREPAVAGAVRDQLRTALQEHARERGVSSVHLLFHLPEEAAPASEPQWLARRDCQFHWSNRGYTDFEHYLQSFSADKRKKARRERRRVAEDGVSFLTLHGPELTANMLDAIYALHRHTFLRHGHEPYLNREFFTLIAQRLGSALMVKVAVQHGDIIAAAIYFVGRDTLYGRYWGAAGEFHSLHFETCYHQGIDYCIEHGLKKFEPGTQGEHKLSRGFEPTLTQSSHWIADPRFRSAIAEFLDREQPAVADYAREMRAHVPYRR